MEIDATMMGKVFEACMLICFGASWPLAIVKTLKTKNVEGVSIKFFFLIFSGYVCGMLYKVLGNYDGVFWFYLLNLLMVGFEIILYYKYRNVEAQPALQN